MFYSFILFLILFGIKVNASDVETGQKKLKATLVILDSNFKKKKLDNEERLTEFQKFVELSKLAALEVSKHLFRDLKNLDCKKIVENEELFYVVFICNRRIFIFHREFLNDARKKAFYTQDNFIDRRLELEVQEDIDIEKLAFYFHTDYKATSAQLEKLVLPDPSKIILNFCFEELNKEDVQIIDDKIHKFTFETNKNWILQTWTFRKK